MGNSVGVLIPIWSAWAVVAVTMLLDWAIDQWPAWALYAPFLASLLLLGLPHGALDHLVLLRLKRQKPTFSSVVRAVTPYVGIAGLYAFVWWISPGFAFLCFIVMTWFHWGQGDLHSMLVLRSARHLDRRWLRGLTIAIRGGLPMLIPLIAFPDVYRGVAEAIVGIIDAGAINQLEWLFADEFRTGVAVAFLVLVFMYVASTFTRESHGRRTWLEDLFEILLLAGFFSLVHPVLAIGIYFCLWHATRHIARLLLTDDMWANSPRSLLHGLRQFYSQALPTTLAALALLVLMYLAAPRRPVLLDEWLGLYLVLIAVLTLPHVWVVWRMDKAESIWA